MDVDAERERLQREAYSRGVLEEPEAEFTDPATGETLRMRPSEWALRVYERDHPPTADEQAAVPLAEPRMAGPHTVTDAVQPAPRRWRQQAIAAGVGALVGGLIVALALVPMLHTEISQGYPGEEAVDATAFPRIDVPAAVASGFVPESFRTLTASLEPLADASTRLYVARRISGEYCVVVATRQIRLAQLCWSPNRIRDGEILLRRTIVSDGGLRTRVQVRWPLDGNLTVERG